MIELCGIGSYCIGSKIKLKKADKQGLVSCFEQRITRNHGTLEGRAEIATIHLGDIGPVVVKRYTRGGVIRVFNSSTYLKIFQYRCKEEFTLLVLLRQLGIRVPRPIAFAYHGKLLYKAWLISQEIKNARTLAELSRSEPDRVEELMPTLIDQLDMLIDNRIYHVDFHPGNVIVNDQGQLFIIDFDRARTNFRNKTKLHHKYVKRWERAVLKHNLPATLNLTGIKR